MVICEATRRNLEFCYWNPARTIAPARRVCTRACPSTHTYPGPPSADRFEVGRTMRHLRHRFRTPCLDAPAVSGNGVSHDPAGARQWRERIAVGPINEKTGESYGRGTKAYEAEAANPGKTFISRAELADVHAMVTAAKRERRCGRPPFSPLVEAFCWTDPEFGRCKGRRFDCLIERS